MDDTSASSIVYRHVYKSHRIATVERGLILYLDYGRNFNGLTALPFTFTVKCKCTPVE